MSEPTRSKKTIILIDKSIFTLYKLEPSSAADGPQNSKMYCENWPIAFAVR